eukprot:855557-Lingulodinium_polyedra.AAC.1
MVADTEEVAARRARRNGRRPFSQQGPEATYQGGIWYDRRSKTAVRYESKPVVFQQWFDGSEGAVSPGWNCRDPPRLYRLDSDPQAPTLR